MSAAVEKRDQGGATETSHGTLPTIGTRHYFLHHVLHFSLDTDSTPSDHFELPGSLIYAEYATWKSDITNQVLE